MLSIIAINIRKPSKVYRNWTKFFHTPYNVILNKKVANLSAPVSLYLFSFHKRKNRHRLKDFVLLNSTSLNKLNVNSNNNQYLHNNLSTMMCLPNTEKRCIIDLEHLNKLHVNYEHITYTKNFTRPPSTYQTFSCHQSCITTDLNSF